MAGEFFLSVHFEVSFTIIDNNLVIHWLASKVFHVWVHCSCWNCMHVWLTDVLCNHRDSKFPNINLFIISGRDKSSSILYECNCVNWAKMFLILLNNLFLICIKLENLFVGATSQENILLIFCRMELDAKRCSFVCITSYDLPSFSVP